MKPITTYTSNRLHFKADVIEPLGMDEVFEVVTPDPTWRMTKADFCRVFPNVRKSRSYAGARREYHYPKPPEKAEQFRVNNHDGGKVKGPKRAEAATVTRPPRAEVSAEESLRRMESFWERKDQFIASIRKGKS